MNRTWLALDPLDTISVRDGRSFAAGSDTTASAVFPPPSTMAGAIHAGLAKIGRTGPAATRHGPGRVPVPAGRVSRFARLVGPVLHRPGDGLLFAWPRHLVLDDERSPRAQLLRVASGHLDMHDCPVGLLTGSGEVPELAFLPSFDLGLVLDGALDSDDLEGIAVAGAERSAGLVDNEVHVGLYRDGGRTAADGFLYAAQHLRLGRGVSLAARVETEEPVPETLPLVPIGGERRLAQLHRLAVEPQVPKRPASFDGGRVLVYLATPAVFEDGWTPRFEHDVTVVGAAVGRPQPISTRARGRHMLHWTVPAGSVYFVQARSEDEALKFARAVHDRALFQSEARLRTSGFGWCFTGRWA